MVDDPQWRSNIKNEQEKDDVKLTLSDHISENNHQNSMNMIFERNIEV